MLIWRNIGLCVIAAAMFACSSGNKHSVSDRGEVQTNHAQLEIQEGTVAVGEASIVELILRNVGVGDLKIESIELVYVRPEGAVEATDALKLVVGQAMSATIAPKPGGPDWTIGVMYTRPSDDLRRYATLRIVSDSQKAADRVLEIPIASVEGLPVANLSPNVVNLGNVAADQNKKMPLTLSNTGMDSLTIASAAFSGHADLRFDDGEAEFAPGESISWDPPMVILAGEKRTFAVSYTAHEASPVDGKLVFFTNDPAQVTGTLAVIQANHGTPCLLSSPSHVQFGGKLVGKKAILPVRLTNCGSVPVNLGAIELTTDSHGDFEVEAESLPNTLAVNQEADLYVSFLPSVVADAGLSGTPQLSEGTLVVHSDAYDPQLLVAISGFGALEEAPTAVIVVQEGEQVTPQTTLHLLGDQSFGPLPVASWGWSVKGPAGSVDSFYPSNTQPNPTFTANVSGAYDFELNVWDSSGVKSLMPAKVTVLVVSEDAIHVELLWHTPNDPDESDEGPSAGADLDLHFAHLKYADGSIDLDNDGKNDPWFDTVFDCFWFNPHPEWASFTSQADNPGLDRDDTDGAGPENLNLDQPEAATYGIAVHYWADHDYGKSEATVRIYLYGQLVFEQADVELYNHDMWNVATIEWPSGQVKSVKGQGGGLHITPDYQNPWFFQP